MGGRGGHSKAGGGMVRVGGGNLAPGSLEAARAMKEYYESQHLTGARILTNGTRYVTSNSWDDYDAGIRRGYREYEG